MAARKKSAKKKRPAAAAEKHFVEDLITRGQAVVKTSPDQKLPPGATHWIIEDPETGERTVERARFSMI